MCVMIHESAAVVLYCVSKPTDGVKHFL